MSTGTIEVVTPDMWRRQRDLRLAALAQAPEQFGSTLAREQEFSDDTWRERASRPSTLLASVDGRDVAIAGVYLHDDTWQVNAMWIEPEHRGRGIADALLAGCEVLVRQAGASRMQLWVFEDNPAGLGAYTRAGFELTGTRDHVRDGRHVLEMLKRW